MVHDKPGSESEQRAAFPAFLTGLKGESWHQLQRTAESAECRSWHRGGKKYFKL